MLISAINNVNDLIYIDGDIKVVELCLLTCLAIYIFQLKVFWGLKRIGTTLMVYLMESVCADRNLHELSELSVVAVFLCDTAGVVDLQTKQNIYWWGKACKAHVIFSRFRLECMSFFCNKYIITWSCNAQVLSGLRLLVTPYSVTLHIISPPCQMPD